MGCKVFQRLFFNSFFWFDLAYRSCDLPTRYYLRRWVQVPNNFIPLTTLT